MKFVRECLPYAPGETAGFPEERAEQLLAAGIAELVLPEAEEISAEPALEPAPNEDDEGEGSDPDPEE